MLTCMTYAPLLVLDIQQTLQIVEWGISLVYGNLYDTYYCNAWNYIQTFPIRRVPTET